MRDRGAVLIEFALVAPLLIGVIVGGLILGVAQIQRMQMLTAATTATDLWSRGEISEAEAVAYASQTGQVVCSSDQPNGCYVSGLPAGVEAVQLILVGAEMRYLVGSVTPGARVTATVMP